MITDGAYISKTPQSALRKIESTVVRSLWGHRPIARSKWLVQLFHGQPHRNNPKLALAYNSILDLFRFCFDCPHVVPRLKQLWPNRHMLNHSLVKTYEESCAILGLEVTDDLSIRLAESPASLGCTSPRDIATVLQRMARQTMYVAAKTSKRKDFLQPKGLIDSHASTSFLRKPTFEITGFPTT